jgi:hypothetical protein
MRSAKLKKYTVVTTANLPLGRARKEMPAAERKGAFISCNEEAIYDSGVRYEDLVGRRRSGRDQARLRHHLECIANESAILLHVTRPLPEYDVLVERLPKYARSAFINHDDLFAGKWETHSTSCSRSRSRRTTRSPRPTAPTSRPKILLKALDKPPKKPRGRPKAKF